MLAIIAAIIFAIAFIIRVTGTATGAVFAPDSLLLVDTGSSLTGAVVTLGGVER